MHKKILVGLVIGILLLGSVFAFQLQTIYNPFTGRMDYTVTSNFSGDNVTADWFFGDGALFNSGWQNGGVTIDGGNIYAQVGYFYNLTSLNVSKQNLTIIENLDVGGNVSALYFIGDGSLLTGVTAVSASWNRTGTDVFLHHTGDSVGIGTASPFRKLDVNSTEAVASRFKGTNAVGTYVDIGTDAINKDAAIRFQENDVGKWIVGNDGSDADKFKFSTSEALETNTRMTIDATGQVGIGTASPNVQLHVFDATENCNLKVETDKVNGEASVRYLNDAQVWRTGITSSDHFSIYDITDSRNVLDIDGAGNVGIGTSSPDFNLDVEGVASVVRIYATGANSTPNLKLKNDVQTWELRTAGADADRFTIQDTTGSTVPVRIDKATPTNTLRLTSTGNVGIGTTTPHDELNVIGDTRVQATSAFSTTHNEPHGLYIKDTGGTKGIDNYGAGISFSRINETTTGSGQRAGIAPVQSSADDDAMGIAFFIHGGDATDPIVEKVRIDYLGNVGIGTTTPDSILTVSQASGADLTGLRLVTTGPATDEDELKISWYQRGTLDSTTRETAKINSILESSTSHSGHLAFHTLSGDLSLYERMRITDDGNVGIGTTSPSSALEVTGNITISGTNDVVFYNNGTHLIID